ncbi:MAG: exodeoxyribonuclease VII large subunit, partial [Spirochaetota bacterium]
QGDQAAARIAKMVRIASLHRLGDVVIVGRGGGSIEDLLPFSDETVVRAIVESEVPVISAVGHEVDWALSDFAADVRAPTPSAAAELVAASREELEARILELGRSIVSRFLDRYRHAKLLMRQFSPEELHRSYWMLAQPTLQEFDRLRDEFADAMESRVSDARHRLDMASRELASVSPHRIVKRGYAIVRASDGSILVDARQVTAGDKVAMELRHGAVDATVDATNTGDSDEEL